MLDMLSPFPMPRTQFNGEVVVSWPFFPMHCVFSACSDNWDEFEVWIQIFCFDVLDIKHSSSRAIFAPLYIQVF